MARLYENQSSFLTLQELAQKSVDDAAIKVKKVDETYSNAQAQLNVLNDYYQEYQQRLNNALMTGVNGSELANFQSFISTVEKSISQQQQLLVTLNVKQKQARQHLYQCHKKLNAYTTLLEKQQKIIIQQENRQQQKLTDEFAQQQSARRALNES